jgi:hypothetical protein
MNDSRRHPETLAMVGQFPRPFEPGGAGRALVLFVLFAFVARFGTFLVSSLDWDESLYILGAESLLKGHLPYTRVWDHKPPGIFAVFAAAIALLREPVIAVRLLSCAAVGLTSFGLWKLLRPGLANASLAGPAAGVLYTVFSLGNDGTSANTELFYMTFIVLALVAASRAPAPRWRDAVAAGLLLGVAGSINYLALLYSIAIAAVVLIGPLLDVGRAGYARPMLVERIFKLAVVAMGPALVFSLILGIYGSAGEIDSFIYANVTSNRAYVGAQPLNLGALAAALASQFAGQWLLWVCVPLLPIVVHVAMPLAPLEKRAVLIAAGALLVGLLGVTTSRLYWAHYFLQLNAPLCLIAGIVIGRLVEHAREHSRWLAYCSLVLLAVGGTYNLIRDNAKLTGTIMLNRYVRATTHWGDASAQVGSYIRERIQPGEYIYVVDCSPIIYSIAGADLPTRFVFPPFLIGSDSSRLIDTDALAELDRILARRPRYIVKKQERPDPEGTLDSYYASLNQALTRDYRWERRVAGIDLYRRE